MKLYKREKYLSKIRGFYESTDLIKVISGIRRCGKSSLLLTIINELKQQGINEKNIIYINLDKRGYMGITSPIQLEAIIDKFSNHVKGLKYLFIDEIQNVNNFELLINALREEKDYSIFLTGSNSYLLSGELVTKLTGRYINFEIYPLSFDEYVDMKKFYKIPSNKNLNIELNNYIKEGGFPRTLFFKEFKDKQQYIKNIINEIFEKDIRRRVIIRRPSTFKLVCNYIINNFGSTMSERNICDTLNKNSYKLNRVALSRYINALLDAKIIYECERFDMKSKKMLSGEKKYYLADLSILSTTNPDNRINYGPVLENISFIYAKSNDYKINVGRIGKLECDFILKDKDLNYSYLQVAYTIISSKKTEDREYRSLEKIKDNYPKYIMSLDTLIQKRNGIIHANLIDFMLNKKLF